MAVLHQLLGHDPVARSIEGLAGVVARHDGWLRDRKLLRLTYHLSGAANLESAMSAATCTKHAASTRRRRCPRCTSPTRCWMTAAACGPRLADEKFFAGLGRGDAEGWGSGGWDAASYAAARYAPVGDEARARLVSDLTAAYFRAFTTGAGYLDL